MNDSQSNPIKPGDYFAYAASRGGSEHSAMLFGRVLEVSDSKCKAVTISQSWINPAEGWGWKVPKQAQWLMKPDKLIVIPREALNAKLATILDDAAKARGFEL